MADIFISYSRRDKPFAERLQNQLAESGYDVWIDWEDIPRGEEWLAEIQMGIREANNFIFIISPHSLASEVCHQEVRYAFEHNKRILPVIWQELSRDAEMAIAAQWHDDALRTIYQANWSRLKAINWLFFRESDDFAQRFSELRTTIETDQPYVKLHTRLLVAASHWAEQEADASRLLSGGELEQAERWFASSVGANPAPTVLHSRYIAVSRAAQRQRQRNTLLWISAALIVMTVLAVLSFFLFRRSEANLALANVRATETTHERDLQRAAYFAAQADLNMERDHPTLALALSLAANQMASPPAAAQIALAGIAQQQSGLRAYYSMRTLATDRSGRYALLVDQTNKLILYDLERDAIQASWPLPTDDLNSVAGGEISADLRHAVFWFEYPYNNQISVLDLQTGKERYRLRDVHSGATTTAAIHPNGTQFVTAGGFTISGAEISFWDIASGTRVRQFDAGQYLSPIGGLIFSADGQRLYSGALIIYQLVVWNVSSGKPQRIFEHSGAEGYYSQASKGALTGHTGFAISPDEHLLLANTPKVSVIAWNAQTGEELWSFAKHTGEVENIAFSPNGQQVVSNSDKEILVWDVATRHILNSMPIERDYGFWAPVVLPNGQAVISQTSPEAHLMRWDVAAGYQLFRSKGIGCLTATGAVVAYDGEKLIRYALTAEQTTTITQQAGTAIAFSPDCRQLAIMVEEREPLRRFAAILDVDSAQMTRTDIEPRYASTNAAFSPQGDLLFVDTDNGVAAYEIKSGKIIWQQLPEADIYVVDLVATREAVFVAAETKIWRLDASTGKILKSYEFPSARITGIAYHAPTHQLAVVYDDHSLALLDADSGQEFKKMRDLVVPVPYERISLNQAGTLAVTVSRRPDSPTSLRLVVPEDYLYIALWDLQTGEVIRRYRLYIGGDIARVAFSANEQQLVAVTSNSFATDVGNAETIVLRNDPLPNLIQWSCANRYVRPLSAAEQIIYQISTQAMPCR